MIKGIKKIFSFAVLSFFTGHSFAQTVKGVQKENTVKPNPTTPQSDSAKNGLRQPYKLTNVSKVKESGTDKTKEASNYKVEGTGQKTISAAKTAGKNNK